MSTWRSAFFKQCLFGGRGVFSSVWKYWHKLDHGRFLGVFAHVICIFNSSFQRSTLKFIQHVLNTKVGRNCFSQKPSQLPGPGFTSTIVIWFMGSDRFLQGLPLMCPAMASQNVKDLQRKEKQGNTRAAISLDGAVSFPGAYFSQITLATSTKEKKGF